MTVLLLLSALLSALSGATGSTRAPHVAVAVTRAVTGPHLAETKAAAVTRPVAAAFSSLDVLATTGIAWPLTPISPLYLSRRRE